MRKRRDINVFTISFLDLITGALGAVIILYVAIPKHPLPALPNVMNDTLVKELKTSQEEVSKLKAELNKVKNTVVIPTSEVPAVVFDVGFKFKGKKIVFVIDTSFSMVEQDRMGQVKAGLKMLVTSMSRDYQIDAIQFPFGETAPFKSLFGAIRDAGGENKADVFDFISRLRPDGGTPTRDALLFVLKNYPDITDIVLLSDGAPTYHNSNKRDDIFEILRVVREQNYNKVQINTIGVGADFLQDKTSERYKFLTLLSEETKGFFVGF